MGLLPPLIIFTLLLFAKAIALCTDNLQEKCIEKYYRSTSFWFPTNELKECKKKSYAEFSHICTVEDYLPNIDHCCCSVPRIPATNTKYQEGSSDNVVLCCRYHQDWNRFRCLLDQDVVDPNTFHEGSYASVFGTYPSNLFFYMLFVLLTIILIVIVIHLFRRISRNKRRIYKQASQENMVINNTTNNNTQSTTNIIVSGLPPYTEKDEDVMSSRRRLQSQASAPPVEDASMDVEESSGQLNGGVASTIENSPHHQDFPTNRETPPPPYERISN